jgi:hypothetical protein
MIDKMLRGIRDRTEGRLAECGARGETTSGTTERKA